MPLFRINLGVQFFMVTTSFAGENFNFLQEKMGECLKRIGVSVALTSVSIFTGFLLSLIIPMPALQAFGAQVRN